MNNKHPGKQEKKKYPLLKALFPGLDFSGPNKIKISLNELNDAAENEYGRYLHRLFIKEWEILDRKALIEKFEDEHADSLALIMENENQKLLLKDLNDKLNLLIEMHEKDMKMASSVQHALMLFSPPEIKNYDISFHFQPCASVSGDFYDFYINKDENFLEGVVLADVSGHGIASGLLTILAKPIFFREFSDNPDTPVCKIMDRINYKLINQMEASENYLTAVMLRFDGNKVEYSNSAHPDILLYKNSEEKTIPVQPENGSIQGSLLGIRAVAEPFTSHSFEVESGDILLIYTDCLTESQSPAGEEFGENRISKILSQNKGCSADSIMKSILESFHEFTGTTTFKDDLTIIILKKT